MLRRFAVTTARARVVLSASTASATPGNSGSSADSASISANTDVANSAIRGSGTPTQRPSASNDMESMRQFAGIMLHDEPIPDETTILKFRRLLEDNNLTEALFAEVRGFLDDKGLMLKQGTIVDASMIAAPPSTKNKAGKRDPEMSQTKKANQWYFGMKAHIGVDADSGLVHSVEATTAKTHDSKVVNELLHGEERDVHGDKAYASKERNLLNSDPKNRIWCMPFKKPHGEDLPEWQREINRGLSSLRAKVEHPFRVIKCQFGYRKVRYKGLAKNAQQQQTLFALANLYLARKRLLAMTG